MHRVEAKTKESGPKLVYAETKLKVCIVDDWGAVAAGNNSIPRYGILLNGKRGPSRVGRRRTRDRSCARAIHPNQPPAIGQIPTDSNSSHARLPRCTFPTLSPFKLWHSLEAIELECHLRYKNNWVSSTGTLISPRSSIACRCPCRARLAPNRAPHAPS